MEDDDAGGDAAVVAGDGVDDGDDDAGGGGDGVDGVGVGGMSSFGGGADGVTDGGEVSLAGFFSIFLQGFIWLEDLTRRRKRGVGDEGRGPAHLSCRRRGRRGGQGTDGGGGRKRPLGEDKVKHALDVIRRNANNL